MLLSHIKHYLTDAGISYFPTWFQEIGSAIASFDGFMGSDFSYDLENKNCIHIWTKFESQEFLTIWAKSSIHDALIEKIVPYRTQATEVKKYTVAASQKPIATL